MSTERRQLRRKEDQLRAELESVEQLISDKIRARILAALAFLGVIFAASVAAVLAGVADDLPVIGGIDPRLLQGGLLAVVLLFVLYSFERERNFRQLARSLTSNRIETAGMAARLELLNEVQTERDMVSALVASSADGIMVVDSERRVRRFNPAAENLTGLEAEAVIGITCEEALGCRTDEGSLACGDCPFAHVLKEAAKPLAEHAWEYKKARTESRWISGAFARVGHPKRRATDTDKLGALAIGSLRDISQNKEVERLQSDFVSIVSHELRGPLTAIKGFVKTLLFKGHRLPDETKAEFLETISDQADRLNQLVEDLLNVSRIESRRLKMNLVEIDPEEIVSKLVNQFSAKWGTRTIIVDADPTLPNIWADESKFEEIIINLVDNAVKYSPEGGDVRVGMWPTNETVEIAVEDSGIGMAPEDVANLFQKFHRVATPQTRDIGGTGLGLYIVKSLVEAHGGHIVVSSAPGVGSTFTVSLPKGSAAEASAR